MPHPHFSQIALDLSQPPEANWSNFIVAHNQELVAALRALPQQLAQGGLAAEHRLIYLWGEEGAGRTHVLEACQRAALQAGQAGMRLSAAHAPSFFAHRADCTLYTVDDVEQLDDAQQIALFNLYNEVRAQPHHALLVTGSQPPRGLALREDLRTRLGWGLVYQLQALNDQDKIAALQAAAKARGLVLSADVPHWLLTHFYRDMPSLMALLDALDTYSLEQKRAVTLPLVRQMLGKL